MEEASELRIIILLCVHCICKKRVLGRMPEWALRINIGEEVRVGYTLKNVNYKS